MNVLLVISWIWLVCGLIDMVLTSPNLIITWVRVRYWKAQDGTDDAPLVVQWSNLRVHLVLFALGLLFFVLGLVGVFQPTQPSIYLIITFGALTVLPLLGSALAVLIASDERYVATTTKQT